MWIITYGYTNVKHSITLSYGGMKLKKFGDRLKEARKLCKFTQRELAIICDTNEGIIRAYEKWRRSPSKNMMVRLFEALKASPDFFFQDELSFNSFNNKNLLFSDISKLSPAHYNLVRKFVDNLKEEYE